MRKNPIATEYSEFDKIVKKTYQGAVNRGENTVLLDVMDLFEREEYELIAVDGSHINDIGIYRAADGLIRILED